MPHHSQPHPCTLCNAHNSLFPNPLHPHVLSKDQFTRWLTPFGIDHMNGLTEFFPPHLIAMSHILISKSVTPLTLSNYASGLLRFTKFCNDYKIPESFRMPASEALLTMFITCCTTASVSSLTLWHWVLGLELWHEINGAPWLSCSTLKWAVKVVNLLPPIYLS